MEKIVISTVYSDLNKSDEERIIDCKSHKHALKLFKKLQDKLSKEYSKQINANEDRDWGRKQCMVFRNDADVDNTKYVVLQRVVCSQRHYDEVTQALGVLVPF